MLPDVVSLRYPDDVVINGSNEVRQMEQRTDQHITEGSPERGLLGHLLLPVVIALAVGTSWYLLSGADTAGFLTAVLLILTPGLAVTFGVSMSGLRGFTMSVLVAAAVVVGVFLREGDLSENPEDGFGYILLFAMVVTFFMVAFWVVGVVVGSVWRRVARRA